jgi:endonuclease/exonuclease/phosphatase (EEP) superfamily protein YafD
MPRTRRHRIPDTASNTPTPTRPSARVRIVALLGWFAVAAMLVVLFTQTFSDGTVRPLIVASQTLLPYGAPLAVPIGVAALVTGRRALAIASAIAVVGTGVLAAPLIAPLIWHPEPATVDADAPTLEVTFANLYWTSTTPALAADAVLDTQADVVVLAEVTPAAIEAFDALGGADGYPYRAGRPADSADGLMIMSRFPLEDVSLARIGPTPGVDVTVTVGERRLRVITIHPDPPFTELGRETWLPSLRALNAVATAETGPLLITADVNASWWNPPYRRVLLPGLTDVHRVLGDGFSTSWPADRRLIPAFTRIDHALIRGNVEPIAIDDVMIPGSDHEGFTVRLALGR